MTSLSHGLPHGLPHDLPHDLPPDSDTDSDTAQGLLILGTACRVLPRKISPRENRGTAVGRDELPHVRVLQCRREEEEYGDRAKSI